MKSLLLRTLILFSPLPLMLLMFATQAAAKNNTKIAVRAPSKTAAFFATLFSDSSSKKIQEELKDIGVVQIGKIALGTVVDGGNYFHFYIKREKLVALYALFKSNGTLVLDGSQDPLAQDTEAVRFVLRLFPQARMGGEHSLLIQRIVPDPEIARAEMSSFLTSQDYKFSGKSILNVKIKNLAQYDKLLEYAQRQGSLLIKQTSEWDNKSLRWGFSKQTAGKVNAQRSELVFTPARNLSPEELQKFKQDIWSRSSTAKELPRLYIDIIKYGDLSVYGVAKGPAYHAKIAEASRPVNNTVVSQPQEASQRPPQETLPKEVVEFMASSHADLYLETESEKLFSYLAQPTVRGYYKGAGKLTWKDQEVPLHNNFFEVIWPQKENEKETILKVTEDSAVKAFVFSAEKFPANNLNIAGSFVKKDPETTSVLVAADFLHWFERPFDVYRKSLLFQRVGLQAHYFSVTNVVNKNDFLTIGVDLKYKIKTAVDDQALGFVSALTYDYMKSADFQGNLLGLKISYEGLIPLPYFQDIKKSYEIFAKAHLWGPSMEITRSYFYGIHGRVYFKPSFYIQAGAQVADISIGNSQDHQKISLNFTLFDGGLGWVF